MQQSSDALVSFASSNTHKYDEARSLLSDVGIRTRHLKADLLEVQSDSLCEVACSKARDAYSQFGVPVLVEDDGLFIDALGGFPGSYSSYAYKTIGIGGILRLLRDEGGRDYGSRGRCAKFAAAVSYHDGKTSCTFEASVSGMISSYPRGEGWGYDPVFVPCIDTHDKNINTHPYATPAPCEGDATSSCQTQTFAEMQTQQKIKISHRTAALRKFADWYLER